MFTKKHYQKIAKIIHNASDCCADCKIADIYEGLCALFESDNPNFDREKFLKACGIN